LDGRVSGVGATNWTTPILNRGAYYRGVLSGKGLSVRRLRVRPAARGDHAETPRSGSRRLAVRPVPRLRAPDRGVCVAHLSTTSTVATTATSWSDRQVHSVRIGTDALPDLNGLAVNARSTLPARRVIAPRSPTSAAAMARSEPPRLLLQGRSHTGSTPSGSG
jgi:hypothetical protein